METLSRVPKFDGPKYEAMLNSAMQVCTLPRDGVGVLIQQVFLLPPLGFADGCVSCKLDQNTSRLRRETMSTPILKIYLC